LPVDRRQQTPYISAMASVQIERKEAVQQSPSVVTLSERKRLRVDQIRAGISALREELARYGRAHGGSFWLFGSAATGDLHYESDVDILVDFEDPRMVAALDFAEHTCDRLCLRPDISPKSWFASAFIDRIKPTALVLP
jgi:predicted nucleotidyltransferase